MVLVETLSSTGLGAARQTKCWISGQVSVEGMCGRESGERVDCLLLVLEYFEKG